MGTNPTNVTNQASAGAEGTETDVPSEPLRLEVSAVAPSEGRSTIRIILDGELDPHTAPQFQRQIDEAIDGGCQILVVDLGRLRFIDSAGLRVVINAHKRLETAGGALIIESPSDTALRLFDITGLTDHFTIHEGPS